MVNYFPFLDYFLNLEVCAAWLVWCMVSCCGDVGMDKCVKNETRILFHSSFFLFLSLRSILPLLIILLFHSGVVCMYTYTYTCTCRCEIEGGQNETISWFDGFIYQDINLKTHIIQREGGTSRIEWKRREILPWFHFSIYLSIFRYIYPPLTVTLCEYTNVRIHQLFTYISHSPFPFQLAPEIGISTSLKTTAVPSPL